MERRFAALRLTMERRFFCYIYIIKKRCCGGKKKTKKAANLCFCRLQYAGGRLSPRWLRLHDQKEEVNGELYREKCVPALTRKHDATKGVVGLDSLNKPC